MRVRIHLGVDFDGNQSLEWAPSDSPGAVDVPKTTLQRWANEREAFKLAYLRWKRVAEEIDEFLYKAEQSRARAANSSQTTEAEPVYAVATAPAAHRRR